MAYGRKNFKKKSSSYKKKGGKRKGGKGGKPLNTYRMARGGRKL